MTTFIYVLKDPRNNEVRYVGQSRKPKFRYLAHLWPCKRGVNRHKDAWIDELSAVGMRPIMEVIEECGDNSWKEAERRWIAHYRSLGVRLVNQTSGGDGAPDLPPETRKRISAAVSAALKGKPLSPEHKAVFLAGARRVRLPPEFHRYLGALNRERMLGVKRGPQSDEHKGRIGAAAIIRDWRKKLSKKDALFLARNGQDPLVVVPWSTWVMLIK